MELKACIRQEAPGGSKSRRGHVRGFEEAVETLGSGLLRQAGGRSGRVGPHLLASMFQTAVVTACRLLFIVYAYRRDLVPGLDSKTLIDDLVRAGEDRRLVGGFGKRSFALWNTLEQVFGMLGSTLSQSVPGQRISDDALAQAVHVLLLSGASSGRAARTYRGQHPVTLREINHIGKAYESVLDCVPKVMGGRMVLIRRSKRCRRKLSGAYYTPGRVVQEIVGNALGLLVRGRREPAGAPGKSLSAEQILALRVVDPAMGSGNLLLSATAYLARAYARALRSEGRAEVSGPVGWIEAAPYRSLVARRCIYGVDVDPVAVDLARLCLWLFSGETALPQAFLERQLKCGDSLFGAGFDGAGFDEVLPHRRDRPRRVGYSEAGLMHNPESRPFHWALEFPQLALHRDGSPRSDPGFDAVIGNPPYLSFSGRQKADRNEWMTGLSRVLGVGKGWVTSHGLFMVRAARLARDCGCVSMVVPAQVGHLKGYEAVRARMLEEGRLMRVRYWGEEVFEDATTPVLTFVLRKSVSPGKPQAALGSAVAIYEDGSRERFSPRPGEEWLGTRSWEMHKAMAARHRTLDGFGDPGVHTGNLAGKIVLTYGAEGTLPVIEGKQVHPFWCGPPQCWLDASYVPEAGEYFRVSPAHVYENTHILIRQTASRPVAARHVFRCHFRNSVLALRVPEGFSVEYVLGVLNSEAAAALYRALVFESRQRAFPQVKVRYLRRLLVPDPGLDGNAPKVARIEKIVRVLEARRRPVDSGDPLMQELNGLVWSLYGIKPSSLRT